MKKIFLGLAFATISFLSSNVFAMGGRVGIEQPFQIGNVVHIPFTNGATIEFNISTNEMRFFPSAGLTGAAAAPVEIPAHIRSAALTRISEFLRGNMGQPFQIGDVVHIPFTDGATIEFNSSTNEMRFFPSAGQAGEQGGVAIPPILRNTAKVRIHAFLNRGDRINYPQLARTTAAGISSVYSSISTKTTCAVVIAVFSFFLASRLLHTINFLTNFDQDNFYGNCAKVAWQHGRYGVGMFCSTMDNGAAFIHFYSSYLLGAVLAIIIFKKLNS